MGFLDLLLTWAMIGGCDARARRERDAYEQQRQQLEQMRHQQIIEQLKTQQLIEEIKRLKEEK